MKTGLIKRIIAISVAGMMSVSLLLTGCGSKEKTPSTQTPAPTSSATATPEPRKTISVAIYDRGNIPAAEGTVDNNRWTKWVNENAPVNVKFVPIPRQTSKDKYNVLFASGEAPDLCLEYDKSILDQFLSNKQLMPLDDVVNKYSKEYKQLTEKYGVFKKFANSDGKMYYVMKASAASINHTLLIRNDWLKNVKMNMPTNMDELYNVAKAFTEQDPDGNGKSDTLGLSFTGYTNSVLDYFFGNVGWRAKDGKFSYAFDELKAVTEFKKKIYDAGYTDKDYPTDTNGAKAQQDFINGKMGIFGFGSGASLLALMDSVLKNNPKAEVTVIPSIQTQFGKFAPAQTGGAQVAGAINKACKNPDAVMKYLDWLNTESVYLHLMYGGDAYSKKTETGAYVPLDAAKFKNEVSYNSDIYMATSGVISKANDYKLSLDQKVPAQKMTYDITVAAENAYLKSKITDPKIGNSPLPALSSDMNLIITNTVGSSPGGITGSKLLDTMTKAVISGKNYTVDQAMADVKKAYDAGNGKVVEAFYDKYYQENKNKMPNADDFFQFLN